MPHHELKIHPEFYEKVMLRKKSWELRKADRDFQVGDTIELREWNPQGEVLTGKALKRRITYILRGPVFGLQDGYVIMSIAPLLEDQ